MESLRKRQLSFDANNFVKNVYISVRACVPNFEVQRHSYKSQAPRMK